MNEDRILNKLDELGQSMTDVKVGLARVEEQIKDVPDLKAKVASLERFKWTTLGALAMAGSSLGSQIYTALKGA